MTDLAAQLHALADQVDRLKPGEVIGTLEKIKFEVWTNAATVPIVSPEPSSSRSLAAPPVLLVSLAVTCVI